MVQTNRTFLAHQCCHCPTHSCPAQRLSALLDEVGLHDFREFLPVSQPARTTQPNASDPIWAEEYYQPTLQIKVEYNDHYKQASK